MGYRLPLQIESRPLGELDAATVGFWARVSLALGKNYGSSGANRYTTIHGLSCITWVKLVRGRWCIVATSNLSQSRLVIFDGLGGLSSDRMVNFYLEGPVMDGEIEDTPTGINIALSIGTKCER